MISSRKTLNESKNTEMLKDLMLRIIILGIQDHVDHLFLFEKIFVDIFFYKFDKV